MASHWDGCQFLMACVMQNVLRFIEVLIAETKKSFHLVTERVDG